MGFSLKSVPSTLVSQLPAFTIFSTALNHPQILSEPASTLPKSSQDQLLKPAKLMTRRAKTSSAKGAKGGDMIYQVQFLAKDVSTQFNTNVYRILLYTHEGLGSNFFPQKATNLHTSKDACKKVEASFANLTKFNSWVDCVVEKRNGYYFIKDTKMIY